MNKKYAVLSIRHEESSDSDKIELMDVFDDMDDCRGYIWRYDGKLLKPGDIFTICDLAYVSDVYNYSEGTYIFGEDLEMHKAPLIRLENATWLSAWNNESAASWLAIASRIHVDRTIIAKALASCVRSIVMPLLTKDYKHLVKYNIILDAVVSMDVELSNRVLLSLDYHSIGGAVDLIIYHIISDLVYYCDTGKERLIHSLMSQSFNLYQNRDQVELEAAGIVKSIIPLRLALLNVVKNNKKSI